MHYIYHLLTLPKLRNLLPKFFIFAVLLVSATQAKAQITPDNTLGAERSVFTTNTLIQGKGINADLITGGAQRGRNLFHSFSDFNVNPGQSVYFANPSDVTNILTRVTGGNRSNILGTLGVDGAANLFLINPAGILFGSGAKLDLKGSFVGTTANGVQFGNLGSFSATNPQAPAPLLTIDPSGLLFNQLNQGAMITNQSTADAGLAPTGLSSSGLRVPDGKSLLLVGGDINMDGGRLRAYGGHVELGGLTSPGTVGLTVDGNNLSLSFPMQSTRGTVSLTNGANINVSAGNGGSITVNASDINITGGSALIAGIAQGLGSIGAKAGDITLNATRDIKIDGNGSYIADYVQPQAIGDGGNITLSSSSLELSGGAYLEANTVGHGNAGNINVTTGSFSVTNGSELLSDTAGQGNGGNITINARDTISFDGKNSDNYTRALTNVQSGGVGKAGDIQVTTGTLSLTNGALLDSGVSGKGNGGNIIINASNAVTFDGSSYAVTDVFQGAVGNAGDIKVTTGSLSLTNGSQLDTGVSGQGNAGNITINARDTVNLDGVVGSSISGVESDLLTGGVGKAGNIQITTGSLSVTNSAQISSYSDGQGNAGDITLNARDTITFDGVGDKSLLGGNASTFLGSNGIGSAGNISVSARALFLKNGGQLNAASSGQGNAGTITINTADTVAIDGVGINGLSSGVVPFGIGNAGDIQITTGTLSLTNGGELFGVSRANASNITVNARDAIIIDGVGSNGNRSEITSSLLSGGVGGKGGDIQLTTNSLTVSNGAVLASFTTGQGNAGNINLSTGSFSLTNGSELLSSTAGRGNGGNITINARDSVKFDGAGSSQNPTGAYSTVDSGGVGKAGNINVTAGSLSLNNGSQISATTVGQGNGGDININARESITLNGKGSNGRFSGIFSAVGTGGVGKAGNLNLTTSSLSLNNGAELATATASGNGGDIKITAQDYILLRNGSLISTNAGIANAGGNGGNIIINSPFIVAVPNENSDITANAFSGSGGQININAQVFGIEPRQELLPPTNDITASSQLGVQGQINVTQPQVDLVSGLVAPPIQLADVTTKFSQLCPNTANPKKKPLGSFVITGRGSIPPNPLELLPGRNPDIPLANAEDMQEIKAIQAQERRKKEEQEHSSKVGRKKNKDNTLPSIVEAQGIVQTPDGQIYFVANANHATPSSQPTASPCPSQK